jgi:hypothetical protein
MADRGHLVVLLSLTLAACVPGPESAGPALADDAVEVPPALRLGRLRPYAMAPTLLYLNVDGATITKGLGSDAHANLSFICGTTIPPLDATIYGTDRDIVVTLLASKVGQLFADFNLQVVTSRPAAPPYDMVVVGGDAALCGYPSGTAGMGPLDCGNLLHGEIAFVYAQTISNLDMLAIATAHEAAHSYGLVHSMDPCDVMSNYYCATLKTFLNRQMAVSPDHYGKCGQTSTNSWAKLLDVLGPREEPIVDTTPPLVRITSPSAGQRVPPAVTVRVEAADDVGVERVELAVDGAPQGQRTTAPYDFQLSGLALGPHRAAARAFDRAGNVAEATSAMIVEPTPHADGTRPAPDRGADAAVPAPPPAGCQHAPGQSSSNFFLPPLLILGLLFMGRVRSLRRPVRRRWARRSGVQAWASSTNSPPPPATRARTASWSSSV